MFIYLGYSLQFKQNKVTKLTITAINVNSLPDGINKIDSLFYKWGFPLYSKTPSNLRLVD